MTDRPDTPVELKARALRHLARREHSRKELARKLAPHAESGEALEALLDALATKQQLSDDRYADARARQLARKYGAARIVHDLRSKGVDDETAAGAVSDARAGELARAREILRRKYRTSAETAEARAKRARFLHSRGFSFDVIRSALALSSADTE